MVCTDCYSYAKGSPVDFYSLREAAVIDGLCKNFLLIASDLLQEPAERLNFARAAMADFEGRLRRREIDLHLMLRLVNENHRKILTQMLYEPAA